MQNTILSEFEAIATGLWLEGLAIDQDRNRIWYSDVIGGGIHCLMPDGTTRTFNADRLWTGGLMLNDDGVILSTGQGGIKWNHLESGQSGWLINEIDGTPINGINEMTTDGAGGMYFGTVDIERVALGGETRPTAIYRLSKDGQVTLEAEDINFTNGMMLSKDGTRLYCNDSFKCSYVFDVNADRHLTNQRVLLEKDDADGMALDAAGHVWITGFRSSTISRVTPEGKVLDAVTTTAQAITQVRFGGPDGRDCYFTAVPADGGDALKDGQMPTEHQSTLYRCRSSIAGMPISPTALQFNY